MLRFLECSIFVENRKLKENKKTKNTPNGQTSKPLPKTKQKNRKS
jgi:hypothetical protein